MDIDLIRHDDAFLRRQQSQNNIHHRRLSSPGCTDKGHCLSFLNRQAGIVDHRLIGVRITVSDMFYFNPLMKIPGFPDFMILFLDVIRNLRKVVINQINRGQCIQHVRGMFIDPPYTGHQPKGCHGKYCQLRNIVSHICLSKQQLDNKQHANLPFIPFVKNISQFREQSRSRIVI